MKRTARQALLLSMVSSTLFALGCADDGADMPPPMPTPMDTTPHVDVVGTYTLQPGEEKYYCYTLKVPAELSQAVTRIVPTYGNGTHHILFSQSIAPEPDGMSECPVLSKNTWLPLYAAGKESGPLSPPSGSALRLIVSGQQLVLQLHLQNATSKVITDKTTVRVELAPTAAADGFTWAGLYGFDDHKITLPPHTQGTESSMTCTLSRDMSVFAVLGHMHKRGRHLQLGRSTPTGDEILYQEDWNFDLQPITPLSLQLHKGDKVTLRCQHDNDTDQTISYGESSDTEMCAAIFYYTPFDHLGGCTQN